MQIVVVEVVPLRRPFPLPLLPPLPFALLVLAVVRLSPRALQPALLLLPQLLRRLLRELERRLEPVRGVRSGLERELSDVEVVRVLRVCFDLGRRRAFCRSVFGGSRRFRRRGALVGGGADQLAEEVAVDARLAGSGEGSFELLVVELRE